MGVSMGSASAFMITGPATKITNLGALKIVLGYAGDRRRWRKQEAGVGAAVEKCPHSGFPMCGQVVLPAKTTPGSTGGRRNA